jgi:hypothetical protein
MRTTLFSLPTVGISTSSAISVPRSDVLRRRRKANQEEALAIPAIMPSRRFIKGSRDGVIDFEYNGMADQLLKGIKVEHGRWLADLLLQLSDQQIRDAFRAANYSDEKPRSSRAHSRRESMHSIAQPA